MTQHPNFWVNRSCSSCSSPDKRWFAAAGNQNVKLDDIRCVNLHAVLIFKGHNDNVTRLVFQYEDKRALCDPELKPQNIGKRLVKLATTCRAYGFDRPTAADTDCHCKSTLNHDMARSEKPRAKTSVQIRVESAFRKQDNGDDAKSVRDDLTVEDAQQLD
ncbi:MAG: hypothetical protein Q9220_007613 [cf. Caloplaca sp. 1 TL-2023]